MADAEEYFPRGGKKLTTTLFKQHENFLGGIERGEKKQRKQEKKSEDDDGYLSDELVQEIDKAYKNCGIWLNYKVVKEGQLLLARIQQVQETKIQVTLPCRMLGVVMACHISEAYNKILEAYVNDQIEKVCELQKMFQPGQYVTVKVLDVLSNKLMLSMMPQHVNSGRILSELHKGTLLQAAVSSVEDHGYVMDIGIPNTRAFLPTKSTNADIPLETGSLTWVSIKSLAPSADSSVVTLTNELAALQKAVQHRKTAALLPATAMEFIVDKPLENGIEGRILGDTTAYIQRNQVDTIKGKKPGLGHKIRARLLYVVSPNNIPFLTMKPIFTSSFPDLTKEQKFTDGDIIEAQVIKIVGRSVHFKLGEGSVGILSLRRVAVHEDLSDEQVLVKSYPIGSVHKVRVLCYNLSDYVYSLTDEPTVLAEKYFKLEELNVGDVVPATITFVADRNLKVTVGRVNGYVPQVHFTETGVFVDPKKASSSKLPKIKFKVGEEVQARVLARDLTKQHLILTLKPSLLDPDLDVMKSYDSASVGKVFTGIIAHISNYLLISFFNNVTAYVPRHRVAAQPVENLADAFHLGQIVKCTIISVHPELKKMQGSLTTAPFTPSERRVDKRKMDNREVPSKKQKTGQSKKKESDINQKNHLSNSSKDTETDTETTTGKKRKKKDKTDKSNDTNPNSNKKLIDTSSYEHNNENNVKSNETEKKRNKKVLEDKRNDKNENQDNNLSKENDIDMLEKNTKERKRKKKEIGGDTDIPNGDIESDLNKKERKKKKKNKINEEDNIEINSDIDSKPKDSIKKQDKKQNDYVQNEELEESDAIETDVYDDSDQILTPQDLNLLDLSDCLTEKNYKKRAVALLKCIKARNKRIERIDKKIAHIEEKGLNAANKKYHTAMFTEKMVIEKRIEKLLETMKVVQEKLNEFDVEFKIDKGKKKKANDPPALETKPFKESAKDVKSDNMPVKNDNKEKHEVSKKMEKEKEKNEDKIVKEVKVLNSLRPAVEVPSIKDFWSLDTDVLVDKEEEESSSSDEEEQGKPKKKRKKLTVAEKAAKAREEEERLREMEKRAIESENAPRSSDQFERALLAQPDCSQLWIAYMAFHLQATEIDKARAVGRKALKTINFREEGEKLNVWLALLNLEHRFGTKESQQKTLEDALQMNETYKIHSKLLDILVDSSKQPELVSLVELMMRKYRRQPETYRVCGEACFKAGLVEKARQVMQKGIAALEKKEHVSLLVRFAQLERGHGEKERSEALFEQILAVYPQRVDVASAYLDLLVKDKHIQQVRQVMERLTSLQLPARKMKVLYKKWIEVEEKIGDKAQVESIRKRALEFINKAQF